MCASFLKRYHFQPLSPATLTNACLTLHTHITQNPFSTEDDDAFVLIEEGDHEVQQTTPPSLFLSKVPLLRRSALTFFAAQGSTGVVTPPPGAHEESFSMVRSTQRK